MPRKTVDPSVIQPVPNTRSLAEVRGYRVGTGEKSWIFRVRHVIDVAVSLTEVGLNLLEDLHDRTRQLMIDAHGSIEEIADERKRENSLYFSSFVIDPLKYGPVTHLSTSPGDVSVESKAQVPSGKKGT